MSPEIVVKAVDLTKKFEDQTAVDHLNLEVPAGSIFGFIGPSGCGKTTTIRLLMGLYEPTDGRVEVFGRPPHEFSRQEREKMGYMPQQFVLYPDLTVWENLQFAGSLYGMPLKRGERLHELLKLVELDEHAGKRGRNLSGGMQRRLSLAAALVHNPSLVFLDEPTAGIDPVLRRKFWDYFLDLQKREHTLFVTTQYVGEAAYCDYVGVMDEGRLILVDTPEGLRRQAQGGDLIHLRLPGEVSYQLLSALRNEKFVKSRKVLRLEDDTIQILVEDASKTLPIVMEWCQAKELEIESANEFVPSFDDIFVKLIEAKKKKVPADA